VPLRNPRLSIHQVGPVLLAFACLATSADRSSPQQSGQAPAQNSNDLPTLHITARLVEVNVIVNDKHGNPIAGLSRKDFTLLDNGKPQEITAFSTETNLPSIPSRAPLEPGTFTNRPEELSNLPASVTVILLDALNTAASDQTLARKQLIRVLQEIQPQEYVAVYWLGNGLHIRHDFTTDSSALRRVVAAFDSKSSRDLDNSHLADPSLNTPNSSTPAGQDYERQAFRLAFDERVANQSTGNRVRATVAALIAIANHLGTRKGRKNLVWVSSSFPVSVGYDKFDLNWTNDTGERFDAEILKAARALTDADIAVYPVDARGLVGSSVSASDQDLDEHIGDPSDTDAHLPSRASPETFDTVRILAERTGGKAFYGTNDLAGAIRCALNDARANYTLGYVPAGIKWDGSFHQIRVAVAAPAADVRARSGYFALPETPSSSSKNDHAIVAQLAASHLPATGIGLHVRVQTSKDARRQTLAVEVKLNLREIQMQNNKGRWTGAVQSVFLQLDNAGHTLQVEDRTFFPEFDALTYERVLRSGMSDTRQVRVVPKAAQLCIVVRDVANGNLGSIYLPLANIFADSSR
jgi:VWFA-related protein